MQFAELAAQHIALVQLLVGCGAFTATEYSHACIAALGEVDQRCAAEKVESIQRLREMLAEDPELSSVLRDPTA